MPSLPNENPITHPGGPPDQPYARLRPRHQEGRARHPADVAEDYIGYGTQNLPLRPWQQNYLGSPERNLMRRFMSPQPGSTERPTFTMANAIAVATAFLRGELTRTELPAFRNLMEVVGMLDLVRAAAYDYVPRDASLYEAKRDQTPDTSRHFRKISINRRLP